MKILVVEDEAKTGEYLCKGLTEAGFVVDLTDNGLNGYHLAMTADYDLIVLDIMLPDVNGWDIVRMLRAANKGMPILLLSARDAIDDKVLGLELGADDYLPKPFHLPELSMRIFALIRRRNFSNDNMLKSDGVEINLLNKTVMVKDKQIILTKSEYELLLFLIENRKRVVSKSALTEHLSGDIADAMDDFNFVYAHIKNLKSKLSTAGINNCIHTYYGTGYKWMENEESAE